MNEMASLIQVLEKVGFPILVSGWFMLRTDKRLDRIIEIQGEILGLIRGKE